jgi:hypothetical protein
VVDHSTLATLTFGEPRSYSNFIFQGGEEKEGRGEGGSRGERKEKKGNSEETYSSGTPTGSPTGFMRVSQLTKEHHSSRRFLPFLNQPYVSIFFV